MTRKFTIDDLLNTNQFANRCPWDLSSDGNLLAVTLSQGNRRIPSDANLGTNGAYILLIDTETGETIEPFPDLQMSWTGRWSPDGEILAANVFLQDAYACIGLWYRQTRDVCLVTDAEVRSISFNAPQWTPDSRQIIVRLASDRVESQESSNVIIRSYDPEQQASDRDQPFFQPPNRKGCIGVIDINSGVIKKLASELKFGVSRMAPNGQALALLNHIGYPVDSTHIIADVTIVPLDGRESYSVARSVPVNNYASRLSWSPDGQIVCYVSGGKGEPQHLCLVPADGSTAPIIAAEFTSYFGNFQTPWWTANGRRLIWLQDGSLYNLSIEEGITHRVLNDSITNNLKVNVIAQRHGESMLHTDAQGNIIAHVTNKLDSLKYIVRINSDTGEMSTVCAAPHSNPDEFTLMASDHFAFARGRVTFDDVLHAYPLEGGATRGLLTTNPWRDDVALPSRTTIEFEDVNGHTQEAALFLPQSRQEGDRVPMVVTIYPGSRFSRRDRYDSEVQLLTSAGFAALYPDSIMEDKNPIEQIVGVTLPAVDRAIEMGFADKNRIGVWGHSYGAYGIIALVTQTNTFRAAIANAPYGINMTSHYVTEVNAMRWCEGKQARNGGSLWENRDSYIENSPFFYLDQVETPVLIICGAQDVPGTMNARETFLGLRRLGKRVEMREYQREGHVMNWSAVDTRDYYERVLNWFNQYLDG